MESKQGNMQKSHWHLLQLNSWNKLSIPLTVSSNCTAWQRGLLKERKCLWQAYDTSQKQSLCLHYSRNFGMINRWKWKKKQWNDKDDSAIDCRSNGACQADVPLPEQNLSDLTQELHCLWMKLQHAGQRQTQLLLFDAAMHITKQRWTYTKI